MQNSIDTAEAELQQELREMFAVDTQQHLDTYFSLIGQLNPQSWVGDIQHLYRSIHTVKGGAMTVAADAMLAVAAVLEDLLSDLRYLEIAPNLADGELAEILLEAGELLSSSVEASKTDEQSTAQVQPTVSRLEELRDRVKQLYLVDWNELKQVHQEFAEQGFDLVTLDLEIALSNLSDAGIVAAMAIDTAEATISQLAQIGVELELAADWTGLLQRCQQLVLQPNCELWQAVWPKYFQLLKTCAKNSGELAASQIELLDETISFVDGFNASVGLISLDIQANQDISGVLDLFFLDEQVEPDLDAIGADFSDNSLGSLDLFLCDEETAEIAVDPGMLAGASHFFPSSHPNFEASALLPTGEGLGMRAIDFGVKSELLPMLSSPELNSYSDDLTAFFRDEVDELSIDSVAVTEKNEAVEFDRFDSENALELSAIEADEAEFTTATVIIAESESSPDLHLVDSFDNLPNLLDDFFGDFSIESEDRSLIVNLETTTTINPTVPVKRSIQIPVPLERLDKSAQQVVDTLLATRAVMSVSSQLKSQLDRLTNLTRESSQFVTRLRQLQDDYALLRNLREEHKDAGNNNVTMERYRQGYTTINRLLENILRLSELGQEIETSIHQSTIRLDTLDRSILHLKDGIEASRLVPFRNLVLRAKAILRDLTNRYGKPAELIIENEHIEIDAGIVQQLEPALLHLLRNAYDHGLESTEQRLTAGKKAQGKIIISLQQQGNIYRLTIEDDGRGIDANLIHQLAQAKGFINNQTRTNTELLSVLCQPGFSSNSTISDVSGRGVGMDVVVAQIASVGGKLSLETYLGHGTKFSIDIPAPQLLIPCVLFQVGDRTIAIPTDTVLETALLSSLTIESVDFPSLKSVGICTWLLTNLNGETPGFDLNNYWQLGSFHSSKSTQRSFPDTAVCIRTRQAPDTPTVWSIADDLLGQAKLLINPLPSPLIPPVGLLGVSLQPDGKLISILDPIALSAMIASPIDLAATANISAETIEDRSSDLTPVTAPTILVVDDAAMIRRRLESSLNTYGFITHTCNDGLEALHWLQSNPHPDLMITDVEMPNMDGFTLIDRARQANINIPILVVSSRLSEEWGKEARRLGATDYLNKGFATSELLQKVNSLLNSEQ
jgi:chemotaxis protein histidine kinase CheA/CheY-like chemotaxis protein